MISVDRVAKMRHRSTFFLRKLSACVLLCYISDCIVSAWTCGDGLEIPDEFRCDAQNDCSDGSDELRENCPNKPCDTETQFQCRENGRCIDKSYFCDGEWDCLYGDHSDEPENCTTHLNVCSSDQYKCPTSGHCISEAWLCDQERDCPDGSDEFNCTCTYNTFGCYVRGNSLCLDNFTKCDGIHHCDDGEDEKDCVSFTSRIEYYCETGHYRCRKNGQCVPWKLVCDGSIDCHDYSDEGGLCHVNDCSQNAQSNREKPCEHMCHQSPDGPKCLCHAGFRLSKDGIHCLDKDECAEMLSAELHNSAKLNKLYEYGLEHVCSQKCHNTHGGYRCVCAEGYMLDSDGYSCKALGVYSPDLYLTVGSEIRVFSLRDPGSQGLYYESIYKSGNPDEKIIDMDVSVPASSVFWIEERSGQLKMKNGYDVADFNLDFKPNAVAVDWVTSNILVSTVNKKTNNVDESSAVAMLVMGERMFADNKNNNMITPYVVDLIATGLKTPVSIAVYPQKGLLVVADAGSTGLDAKILLANLDGSNVHTLVSDNLLTPVDVIVDNVQDAVIWASYSKVSGDATVESVRLDGSQRGVIMSRETNHFPIEPTSLQVFEGHLYVSDKRAREVRSWEMHEISLYGSQNIMYGSQGVVKINSNGLTNIKIAHPVLQQPLRGRNLCVHAGCSHACVMVQRARISKRQLVQQAYRVLVPVCLCPVPLKLFNDKKTCIESKFPSSTSPVITKNSSVETYISNTLPPASALVTPVSPDLICVLPKAPKHMHVKSSDSSSNTLSVGQTITYECFQGFILNNVAHGESSKRFTMTCLPNGKLDSELKKCVEIRSPKKTTHKSTLTSWFDSVRDSMSKLLSKPSKKTSSKVDNRVPNCEPWSELRLDESGDRKCVCLHGKADDKCLPPQNSTISATTALPTPDQPAGLTSSIKALIAVVVLLFLVMSCLCCKCLRQRRYSVDLRYFRSGKKVTVNPNNRDCVVIETSPSGKVTSISNPNYSSPDGRKRLPKPTFDDDRSDSGIQPSSGSGSFTSSASEDICGEGTSSGFLAAQSQPPTNTSPLLGEDPILDEEDGVTISELSFGELGKSMKQSRLSSRFSNIFKMRKTESRECMLPKRKPSRKSRSSYG